MFFSSSQVGVSVLAEAMEGVTQTSQGQDYFLGGLFGRGHWQEKGKWVGNSVKGAFGNFMEGLGGFVEGAMGSLAQEPEDDSYEEYYYEDSDEDDSDEDD